MGRHHKRTKTEKKKPQPLNPIPTDLVIEILERLPVKSIARFLLVSKSWLTLIRSRTFIRSFTVRASSSQPSRLLVAFNRRDYRNNLNNWYFFSSPDFQSRTQIKISDPRRYGTHHYVHGLMSFEYGQDQFISNPSTGKFIILPNIKSRRQVVKRCLGYDPVDGRYKVLCIVKTMYGSGIRAAPSDNQVLTLGSSEWRKIEWCAPHSPVSNSLCIDGVIYYIACSGKKVTVWSLVRFDVKSEKFTFVTTTLQQRSWFNLIHYGETIATADQTSWCTFDLWILEDAVNGKWSKICLSIQPWTTTVIHALRVMGTAITGEIILTHYDDVHELRVIYYDHKKSSQRKFKIQGNANFNFVRMCAPVCFIDHVESVMLL